MADSRYAGEAGLQAVFGQIKAAMAEKQDKINDMGLSHNDYSNEEKQKNAQNASDIVELNSDIDNIIEKMDGDATVYPYADVITIEDAVPSNLADCSVKIEPVQSGSGDPSPTNIRPITGHTEAKVLRTGKNQCPIAKMNTLNSDTFKLNAGTYTISFKMAGSGMYNTSSVILRDDSNADVLSVGVGRASSGTVKKGQFTLQSEKTLHLFENNITASTGGYYIEDIQIELGQTDTPYVPYAGKTYTIALGDTIYGGTVDFDSGVMTVDRKYAEFDGSDDESWEVAYNNANMLISGMKSGDTMDGISNIFATGTSSGTIRFGYNNNNVVYIQGVDTLGISDVEGWKTFLSSSNLQIVYPLATPLTVQLTPQQIQLLKGTNTLTASTGQISVTVNGVSGSIGAVQEQVNDHEERIEAVESGLTNLNSLFVIDSINGHYSVNANSGEYINLYAVANTKTGYTPVGILGYKFNNQNVYASSLTLENSDYGCNIFNTSNRDITNTAYSATILYRKS